MDRMISLDACPRPGFHRPYNFFGIFEQDVMNYFQTQLRSPSVFNHTLVASHYPLSTIAMRRTSTCAFRQDRGSDAV